MQFLPGNSFVFLLRCRAPSNPPPPLIWYSDVLKRHGSHRRIGAVHTLFIPTWHEVAAQ